MKKILSLSFFLVLTISLSFTTAFAATSGTGTTQVQVLAGNLNIVSYPASLNFSDYTIGLASPSSNLTAPFTLVIDDFTGTHAGWSLGATITPFLSGSDVLVAPSLILNTNDATIFNSDASGDPNVSDDAAFTPGDGSISFDTSKKIISAAIGNANAAGRHHFNFPVNSLTLAFSNLTKAGTYAGVSTFELVTGP